MLEQKDSSGEKQTIVAPCPSRTSMVSGGVYPAHQHIFVLKSAPCCPLQSNATTDGAISPPVPDP